MQWSQGEDYAVRALVDMALNPRTQVQEIAARTSVPRPRLAKVIQSLARAGLVEKIRSELNIEKWPAIWQPAKSKNKPALRTMEREVNGEDGNRIEVIRWLEPYDPAVSGAAHLDRGPRRDPRPE